MKNRASPFRMFEKIEKKRKNYRTGLCLHTEPGITERLGQFIHLVAYGFIDDPGVDLGSADFGEAEHFADGFDRDAVGISNGRCKRVPGEV